MHSHHSTLANEQSLYPTLPFPLLTLLVGLAVCTFTRDLRSRGGINDIPGGRAEKMEGRAQGPALQQRLI